MNLKAIAAQIRAQNGTTLKINDDSATEVNSDDRYLGAWLNPQNKQYYLDVITRASNKEDAIAMASAINEASNRKVLAIYNPKQDITVDT